MKLPKYAAKRSYASDDDDDGLVNETCQKPLPLSLVVFDSIQSMVCDAGEASFAGGMMQVRQARCVH
jgi:predicted ATP-dependent serine protease